MYVLTAVYWQIKKLALIKIYNGLQKTEGRREKGTERNKVKQFN
jgi:hypothetical protein